MRTNSVVKVVIRVFRPGRRGRGGSPMRVWVNCMPFSPLRLAGIGVLLVLLGSALSGCYRRFDLVAGFESNGPHSASVYVDGKLVAVMEQSGRGLRRYATPDLTGRHVLHMTNPCVLRLPYGRYEIRVRRAGRRDYVERINVRPTEGEYYLSGP